MSSDRPVATDALETLGTAPIPDNSERDAIHLAVEPAVAGQDSLRPGARVARLIDGTYGLAPTSVEPLGIVDPFLTNYLRKGDRFWLVLFPRQITSLRHVWSHPDFPEATPSCGGCAMPPTGSKAASEAWMRAWAIKHVSEDYYGDSDDGRVSDESAYAFALGIGVDMSVGPHEDARDHIDSEWWDHWETITGKRGDRGSYFSCAC